MKLLLHLALFLACLAFVVVVFVISGAWNISVPDAGLNTSFVRSQEFWLEVGHNIEFPARLLHLPQNLLGFILLLGIWAALLHGCFYAAFVFMRRTFRIFTSAAVLK